jgi:hypothetical protein
MQGFQMEVRLWSVIEDYIQPGQPKDVHQGNILLLSLSGYTGEVIISIEVAVTPLGAKKRDEAEVLKITGTITLDHGVLDSGATRLFLTFLWTLSAFLVVLGR